jgi:TRAP transporter 4TM/12TM fusion protein
MSEQPSQTRALSKYWDLSLQLTMGGVALFYLWAASLGILSFQYSRGVAVLYSVAAPLLLYKGWNRDRSHAPAVLDLLLAAGAAVGVIYWMIEHEELAYRAGAYTEVDFWMGVVVTVAAVEAGRRVLGLGMAMCAVLPILYALFGSHLPFIIGHRGFTFRRIIEYVYLTSDGIFGVMAEIVASFIIPFVVFGAFMQRAGVAKFFIDLSLSAFGRIAGGPAQAAVVSSALLGTINGSPIANTVTTGAVTIPLMKRAGFPSHIAAAVEGAASTGGMVLPPIMGAGAFIMAEMTGVPYLEIVKVAAIPGILFFVSVGIMIYFESRKLGLRALSKEETPRLGDVLKREWYLFTPIVVLTTALIAGLSPQGSAVYGILATVLVSWFRAETRMGPREIWQALVSGGRDCLFVAALTGAVGVFIGILALTGIAIRFSYILVELAGQNLFLTIVLIAAATFIVGLPLPITATYLVVAVVAVPALTKLGVPLLSAHLIVFWLSLDSNITPPIAMGPFAAAAIAGADPMKTGWSCFRFAKIIYVMPLLFAYSHILFTGTWAENLWAVFSAVLGTVLISIVGTAYFYIKTTLVEWLILAVAAFLAFVPVLGTEIAGVVLFAAVYFWQRKRAALAHAGAEPSVQIATK